MLAAWPDVLAAWAAGWPDVLAAWAAGWPDVLAARTAGWPDVLAARTAGWPDVLAGWADLPDASPDMTAGRRPEPGWVRRVEVALGPTGPAAPLGGSAWRLTAGGAPVVAKVGESARDEAAGLQALAAVRGGPAVPGVLLCDGDLLVTTWVAQVQATPAHHERLGAELAVMHGTGAPAWGGGSRWIGACRVDPDPGDDGPAFYRRRLVDLAARCGLGPVVERFADRLDDLVPWASPAVLHGDLWWGNVLWASAGRPVLIDPSHHGGHPEEDLAMLALFGEVPDRLLAAYHEVRPPMDGWEERVELWQLYPLLVHAVLFGGGYLSRAGAVARRFGG